MNQLSNALRILLVACVAGCGAQVVQFETDGGDVVGADATTADAPSTADAGGDDAGGDAAPSAPRVVATLPVGGATGVALPTTLRATFDRPMDETTIDDASFVVTQAGTPVAGVVSYDAPSKTARFNPDADLSAGLFYTARITADVTDTGGLALASDHIWTFTTAASASAPVVESTTPLDLAMGVSINVRPTATFDRAMDPDTLNELTFTLSQGLTPIDGSVSLDGATNTATFRPDQALATGKVYTARITTGAQDTGGLALLVDHTWTFTTSACGQAPVVLGSAASFVVLAGATVTSSGPTSVTGDLGVSPGTAVTGFPPGIIVGAKHAGDPSAAAGIADLTIAYNDAKGRTLCAASVSGNLGGMTLTPGLYKSTSSLAISAGDLTLDGQGDNNAVWVFQMASTLTTTSGRKVILTNGARAANVFWQVGTSATFGTTTAFQGTVMADQAITMNTGATITGRVLARIAAVALASNVIVKPAP